MLSNKDIFDESIKPYKDALKKVASDFQHDKHEHNTELQNTPGTSNVTISVFLLNGQLSQNCMGVPILFCVNFVQRKLCYTKLINGYRKLQYDGFFKYYVIFSPWNHDAIA